MKIDIASMLSNQLKKIGQTSSKAAGKKSPFHEMIAKLLHQHPGKNLIANSPEADTFNPVNERRPQVYLEALRKAFLSKGKPFDQVYIKKEDLHLFKNLLERCGVKHKSIDQCLDRLQEKSRDGKIQLSQIFPALREMDLSKENKSSHVILDSSMIPYLESVLRDFNLNPDEIDRVMNTGRMGEGGLDLHQLITELENIKNPVAGNPSGTVDPERHTAVMENLNSMGVQIPSVKKPGFLRMEDLIASLRRVSFEANNITDTSAEGQPVYLTAKDVKRLSLQALQRKGPRALNAETAGISKSGKETPRDVQEVIDKILESAVDSKEDKGSVKPILAGSKLKFDDPESKLPQIENMAAAQQAVEKRDNPEHQRAVRHEDQKISTFQGRDNIHSAIDMDTGSALKEDINAKHIHDHLDSKIPGIPEETAFEKHTGALSAMDSKNKNFGAPLPNYLFDQIGKQITRAAIRGDGLIKFQLKPQELGFIKLEMQMIDNQINLSVSAENGSVKELLLAHVRELKESLMGHGVKLDTIDVQINNDSNPFFSNSQGRFEREGGTGYGRKNNAFIFTPDGMADSLDENGSHRQIRSHSTMELVV